MKKIKILSITLSLLVVCGCFKMGDNSSLSSINSSINKENSDSTSLLEKEDVKIDNEIINVYLIGGQSNAVGYGMDTNNSVAKSDKRFTEGFENVLYYGAQERWNGEALDQDFKPLKLGYGVSQDRSGAEIGIASAIADNDEMNAIVKCAWGATHLYPETSYEISLSQGTWTSPSYIKNNKIDTSKYEMVGRMYSWFESTVRDALKLLIEDGYTPIIKGMWWMQGEAEMFSYEMSSKYEELLTTLISDIRNSISNITGGDYSEMPFVFGLPKWNTRNSAAPAYQNAVRNSMVRVSENDDIINVSSVDCMPLNQHDDWHFDAAGQKYLGENFIIKVESLDEGFNSSFNENIYINNDVRLLVNECGLEFSAEIINYDTSNNYEYGMIYVPYDELINNDINSDFIEELDNKEINYVVEKRDVSIDDNKKSANIIGRLVNIEYENINTKYAAIAYIKDSNNKYLYSASNINNCVSYLASYALYNETENLDIIKNYVNAGVNYKLNIDESNKYSEADFNLIVEDEIKLNFSQTKSKINLNVKQNPNMDYYVKYSSSNKLVCDVDDAGNLYSNKLGNAEITIQCGGKTKVVKVIVDYLSENGIKIDGIKEEKEYIGENITKSNDKVVLDMQGNVINGDVYLSFVFTHGQWSPYNSSWYLNDNIEFKLNNGESHTIVFYNGEATFSKNISSGVAKTVTEGNMLVTTVELCVKGFNNKYQLKVGMNGSNIGWFAAIWDDGVNYDHKVFITENGIQEKVDLGNGIVLDGEFNEDIYNAQVISNKLDVNANGANVSIMGTLIDKGMIFAVTINHKTNPEKSFKNGEWYSYLNIEFHINNSSKQFIAIYNNRVSRNGMSSYCKSIKTDEGYLSTFEIYIPFASADLSNNVTSLEFTCSGWIETGWCWYFENNQNWNSTHVLTKDGITKKN